MAENVLSKWSHSNRQQLNNVGYMKFGYRHFRLTRYWISDCETKEDFSMIGPITGDDTFNQQKEMPIAWLNMMDKSIMFSKSDHKIHNFYGLKEFIVIKIIGKKHISCEMKDLLIQIFSFVALNFKCHIPLFVEYLNDPYFYLVPGVLVCPSFSTSFKNWRCYKPPQCEANMNDVMELLTFSGLFEGKIPMDIQESAKVSALYIYQVLIREVDYKKKPGLTSDDDTNVYPDIVLYLYATWFDMLQSEVMRHEAKSLLNPLEASKWSIKANVRESVRAPLGSCLMEFYCLWFSNRQISSTMKHKQTKEVNSSLAMKSLTKPKVRKVISKLIPQPEQSLIPVQSLEAILDFLFCDAKLQTPQHSNGDNLSTKTTIEDEVEDKFFLLYKEVSKYFKFAQLTSLSSRLAICLCFVNMYHGGLGAVKQLWGEFILEIKYLLEKNRELKGLEPVEPTLDYPELLQKLQILNSSIKRKKDRGASSTITDSCINECSTGFMRDRDLFADLMKCPSSVLQWRHSLITVRKSGTRVSRQEKFPDDDDDDDATKVLHWLAAVEPSELVLRLMPMLIYSAVTTLLKQPVTLIGYQELIQIRNTLVEQCKKATSCTNEILKEHIGRLTSIEQKMAALPFLMKKFIQIDSSKSFNDSELLELISHLVASKSVQIETSRGELPSNTRLGKLICKFIQGNQLAIKGEEFSDTVAATVKVDEVLRPWSKEYISILDGSKTTGFCQRLSCFVDVDRVHLAVAITNLE